MARGSDDARIHAEAILKAACINAAATMMAAGKIVPKEGTQMENAEHVALYAMWMWNKLEKPDIWPR